MTEMVFALPDVGEGLTEAEIVTWLVKPGDEVQLNQPICDIETAKSVVELPSPFTGRVVELLAQVGQTVPVGDPILRVATADAAPETPDPAAAPPTAETPAPAVEVPAVEVPAAGSAGPAAQADYDT